MGRLWTPFPGPQTAALNSPADILFYGGAAGGGKTDLILGLAFQEHRRSVVFRRHYGDLQGIIDRGNEMLADLIEKRNAGFSGGNQMRWRIKEPKFQRVIELGAAQHEKNIKQWQGRPHDLKGFDELPHFTEKMFRFLSGWNRSAVPGQRQRVVAAGNPPTAPEEEWVVEYFGPWLIDNHEHAAKSGELRWFTTIDGKDQIVESGKPFTHKGELITPKSRTFIQALVEHNPVLMASGYVATLQALPEPLRSKMLYGKFNPDTDDHPFQVIPTQWVMAAQKRWKERPKPDTPMMRLGVDVARGGSDETVLFPCYGAWFDEPMKHPGSSTPNGPKVAALVMKALEGHGGKPVVNIDVIGVGSSVYDHLEAVLNTKVVPVNVSNTSLAKDKSGQLSFYNLRAELYWKLREALDPATGDDLALPPERQLLVQLCAVRWELSARGIKLESKDGVKERIGRSPDLADALVLAHGSVSRGTALLDVYADAVAAKNASQQTQADAASPPASGFEVFIKESL